MEGIIGGPVEPSIERRGKEDNGNASFSWAAKDKTFFISTKATSQIDDSLIVSQGRKEYCWVAFGRRSLAFIIRSL